jgi:hypothetical protein
MGKTPRDTVGEEEAAAAKRLIDQKKFVLANKPRYLRQLKSARARYRILVKTAQEQVDNGELRRGMTTYAEIPVELRKIESFTRLLSMV